MKNIAIVGGGIIGLSSAYYLSRNGHQVTIFDDAPMADSCSFGNAGMVVPSHLTPLAAPGMISKGIRWMFDSKSPFYVKPRLNRDLVNWGLKFYSHANPRHVEQSIPALKEISSISKRLYQQLAAENHFDFGYEERGLLMLYQSSEIEREEIEGAKIANAHGVEARILTPGDVQQLEPDVKVTAKGAVYFPGDAHLIPQKLMAGLTAYLTKQGVSFVRSKVDQFKLEGKNVTGFTAAGKAYLFDEVIIAAGAWSGVICSRLGLKLPMQSGKGYSFTLENVSKNIRIPSLLLEGRVAVTPMGASLRFGGTMEVGGTDRTVNMNRVKGIVETIPKYYPEMSVKLPDVSKVWNGLRPCSPDGMPYIGRARKYNNIIIATGHSMMGVSLGPATGKIVSEIVDETSLSMDILKFDPSRFM